MITFLLMGVLASGVYTTFAYKEERFGDLHLGIAVSRTMQKLALLGVYSARSLAEEGNLLAATFEAGYSQSQENVAHAIPVITYHRLVDEEDGHNVMTKNFVDQMFALKRAGWNTITLEEFERFLKGEITLPERSFLITFDDGAKDSYYPVDPILQILGWNAVSFILPKYSAGPGTSYYLADGEVRAMLRSGRWEIGSHGQNSHELVQIGSDGTMGAALANRLWLPEKGRLETMSEFRARVLADIVDSRDNLEKAFGRDVTAFAFPFGEYGQTNFNTPEGNTTVEGYAIENYDLSFYQIRRGESLSYNYPSDPHMELVKRIEVAPHWNGDDLIAKLERGLPKRMPYTDAFTKDVGWFSVWGSYAIDDGKLLLESEPQETGMAVVLDGGGHWQDYRVKADVISPERTGVVLYARYLDTNNNASCNIGNGFAHVEQIVEGEHRVMRGERSPSIAIPEGTFTLEARVHGRTLTCILNGEELVSSDFLDPTLKRGGIGFKIWDRTPGKAALTVETLSVNPIVTQGTAHR